MKKILAFVAVLGILTGAVLLHSCEGDTAATTGILSITVINTQTGPVPVAHVFLATSYANLINKTYYRDAWADSSGYVKFMDLPPNWYFYQAEGWDDVGATQVFIGTDHHTILFLNTPHVP